MSEPWIVSSMGGGDMRLAVAQPPPWPTAVRKAAALVELLDTRHRADRADAQETADKLQTVLDALRRRGVEAWLTS